MKHLDSSESAPSLEPHVLTTNNYLLLLICISTNSSDELETLEFHSSSLSTNEID